ncbi:MAG: hypothetical protein HDQ87_10120 [Clostridia bacterium]|nr:hypothetical protein [Clostridia bacterium]
MKLDYAALCLEARVYIPSSVFDRVECGRQLGIVDGDEKETVYAWKDHDPAEWIISGFDHDGVMLYREQAVMEFPAGLESEYSWNQSGDI